MRRDELQKIRSCPNCEFEGTGWVLDTLGDSDKKLCLECGADLESDNE